MLHYLVYERVSAGTDCLDYVHVCVAYIYSSPSSGVVVRTRVVCLMLQIKVEMVGLISMTSTATDSPIQSQYHPYLFPLTFCIHVQMNSTKVQNPRHKMQVAFSLASHTLTHERGSGQAAIVELCNLDGFDDVTSSGATRCDQVI